LKSRSSFPIAILNAALLSLTIPPPGGVAAAQTTSAPMTSSSASRDLEVIHRLEEEYLRAETEDDSALAGSILADDYVGLRPDGSTLGKAEILSRLDQHQRRKQPYLISASNMREHLFGDTACVDYTKVYTRPGNQGAYSENVLHVLIRRNGIWRLQLSTVLPAGRP
jgi:hypothetical protein